MRAYLLFEKRLPSYLRGVVSLVCRMKDAEGSERKNVSPLSGIRLSMLSICFFAEGFLFRIICKVKTLLRFCTYCVFLPKVFWFGPFERSKPLVVFALIGRFCRRFFGSDLLKGRSPLTFLHLLCVCVDKYAKFAGSAYFANLLFYLACRCLPKLAILAA